MSPEDPSHAELSVVIPCHDVAGTIGEQLDALLAQEWDGEWEIVVVENGSTDATAAVLDAYATRDRRVRVVREGRVGGANHARNAGVRVALGERLLFCDGDDIVQPGWIAHLAEGLERYRVVTGALDGAMLNGSELARSRGSYDTAPSVLGACSGLHGGNMGAWRDALNTVGAFDPDERICEDMLLAIALHRAGIEVGYVPRAVVAYRYRTDLRSLLRQGFSYGMARVRVAEELRRAALRAPSRLAGARSWAWLIAALPRTVRPAGRRSWVWVAANRAGHVAGSVRHRTVQL